MIIMHIMSMNICTDFGVPEGLFLSYKNMKIFIEKRLIFPGNFYS